MKLLLTHEIKTRAMAHALDAEGHHELRDAGADQNKCTVLSARDEIQLSQSVAQAANREGSGNSLRLTPDWLRTGCSNGRGE